MGAVVEYLEVVEARRDKDLEDEIRRVHERVVNADRRDVKRIYAKAMAELIRLRSPAQIARMERARRLAASKRQMPRGFD